ncbi:MAG: hypothetical protein Q9226_005638 [Calogaya cf. arnoldii]
MPLFSRKGSSVSSKPISKEENNSDTAPLAQDTDAMQRFTATGRPMPSYNPSALGNMPSDFTSQAPQFLPQKFTDESVLVIPVPLSALEAEEASAPKGDNKEPQRRSSLFGKLKKGGEMKGGKKDGFKMVEMTRGEYLKYWAKDEEGRYIGTEPEGQGARRLRERDGGALSR